MSARHTGKQQNLNLGPPRASEFTVMTINPAAVADSGGGKPGPWRSRGYLPHFDQPLLIQFLTFRLHDAVPRRVVEGWKAELGWKESLPATDPREVKLRRLVSKYEDAGHGACCLRDDRVAAVVEETLLLFDGARYRAAAAQEAAKAPEIVEADLSDPEAFFLKYRR